MSKAKLSAIFGVLVATASALISSGLLGGANSSTAQVILNAVVAFAATVGIRSARP